MEKINSIDISVLKYIKQGNELCGFEGVHDNLCKNGYLDSDLELTIKGRQFISDFKEWDSIIPFDNKTYIRVKPTL